MVLIWSIIGLVLVLGKDKIYLTYFAIIKNAMTSSLEFVHCYACVAAWKRFWLTEKAYLFSHNSVICTQ